MDQKLWFKAKRFGWGWTPSTWEGWTVIAVYAVSVIVSTLYGQDHQPLHGTFLVLATVLLIWICRRKGENPTWRWGK